MSAARCQNDFRRTESATSDWLLSNRERQGNTRVGRWQTSIGRLDDNQVLAGRTGGRLDHNGIHSWPPKPVCHFLCPLNGYPVENIGP